MSTNQRITVTLHWRSGEELHAHQMHCDDQIPQQLVPALVEQIGLVTHDDAGDELFYELRLGGEQRPALQPRELLSAQHVRYGSDLWLVPRESRQDNPCPRCLLQLPDGTEIVVPRGGQRFLREWLLEHVRLDNPEAYQRELELIAQRRSAYNYVTNRDAHCTLVLSDRGYWIVTTERTDVWTEYTAGQEFDRVPVDAPIRLDTGMRLRLGGGHGLEIGVVLV